MKKDVYYTVKEIFDITEVDAVPFKYRRLSIRGIVNEQEQRFYLYNPNFTLLITESEFQIKIFVPYDTHINEFMNECVKIKYISDILKKKTKIY